MTAPAPAADSKSEAPQVVSHADAPESSSQTGASSSVAPPPAVAQLRWGIAISATVVGLLWLLVTLRAVTLPLAFAFAAAYVLDPIVDWFEARRVSRSLAILLLMALATVATVVFVIVVVPLVGAEMAELPARLNQVVWQLVVWLETHFDIQLPRSVAALLHTDWLQREAQELTQPLLVLARFVFGTTANVIGLTVGFLVFPLITFFILRDFDRIVAWGASLVPPRWLPELRSHMHDIDHSLSGFVRGQLMVAMILALFYCVGLSLVQVPLALVIGRLTGFGNLVPFLGTAAGIVLATLMSLLAGATPARMAAVLSVFVCAQALESWVLTPRIVGGRTGLSALAVLLAVLTFGDLFGVLGVLIAVPSAAVLKIVLRVLIERYRQSGVYLGTPSHRS